MRGLKSTLALGVVLIGLVAYIYFVDSTKPASNAPEVKAKVFTAEADQIEEIRITPKTGEASRAEKTTGTWQLVEPERTEADQGQLTNAAGSLASLEINRVVDENPTDLTPYGLNAPTIDVAFRLKGQTNLQRLLIGEKTATGGDLYAKRPDEKRVFLIAAYLDTTFDRTPFDLRDKAVLKFDHDKVDGLDIVRGAKVIQLAKSNGEWSLVTPYKARADFAAAEGALTALSSAQMQKIVSPDAANEACNGLNAPTVTATVKSGSTRASLAIGKVEADSVYARDVSRPMVFTIPQATATDLEKEADAFRRKDLFDARSFNTSRLELRRGADTLAFDRSRDKDGKDVWKNAAGATVDTMKVEDLLTKLSNIRATLFRSDSDPALKMPVLVATVKMENDKTETVAFANQGTTALASRPDEPGSATIETVAFNDVIAALDALK